MKRFLSWLKEHAIEIFLIFLLAFLTAVASTLIILSGVRNKTNSIEKVEGLSNRFVILEEFEMGPKVYRVIKDLGTNVLYLVGPQDIELLVDYKGDPVTWDPFGG